MGGLIGLRNFVLQLNIVMRQSQTQTMYFVIFFFLTCLIFHVNHLLRDISHETSSRTGADPGFLEYNGVGGGVALLILSHFS